MLVCYGRYTTFGYSYDGETWTQAPNPCNDGNFGVRGFAASPLDGVAVITGTRVAIGPSDPAAWTDVSVWKTAGIFPSQSYWSAAYSEDLGMFAIGSSIGNATPAIATSTDAGGTWTVHPLGWPSGRQVDVLKWISDLGIFVAAGAYNGSGDYVPRLATSADGVTWTDRTIPDFPNDYGATIQDIAWAPELGRLVAVGSYGFRASSDDAGVTWTRHDTPGYASQYGADAVLWVPERLKFVASGGLAFDSLDGLTWNYTGYQVDITAMVWWKGDHFITDGGYNSLAKSQPAGPTGAPWPPTLSPISSSAPWAGDVEGFGVVPDPEPVSELKVVRRAFV